MKNKIRCFFVDFWQGFDYRYHLAFLLSDYDIVIDKENPDYLFYSCFGYEHLRYDRCIKIFYSGENAIPDLNLCDYAVSLSEIQCGDRTLSLCVPLLKGRDAYQPELEPEKLPDRKFCNFVYSNNNCSDPFREKIFNALSKYKRIDSGGVFLNNMGGRVKDKQAFLKEYKFTLAIENSSQRGYVTEKIFDPFRAQSLPIYWGSPSISSNYRLNSFVNLMDFSSIEEAVEEIIRLDKDDAAYLEKITTPFWPYGDSFEEFYDRENEKRMAFFRNIFDQPLDKARRRTEYGWVKGYVEDMRKQFHSPELVVLEEYKASMKAFVKKMIRR
ncbi:glycosyltransferase family 10 domain-containing protein [Parabacteroides sp.]